MPKNIPDNIDNWDIDKQFGDEESDDDAADIEYIDDFEKETLLADE